MNLHPEPDRQEGCLEGLIFLVYIYKIYLKIDN
jgi:hypothetical protein